MKPASLFTAVLMLASCATTQYIEKGTQDGIAIAYRWNHRPNKPSELLLRLKNTSGMDKTVSLAIDLYYQGRTVEAFEADTCLRPGMMVMGRLNGFYFIPERLTTEQIRNGGAEVEVTRTTVTSNPCR